MLNGKGRSPRARAARALTTSSHARRLLVKRAFNRRALETHPDKGGDADAFQAMYEAFQELKQAFLDGFSEFAKCIESAPAKAKAKAKAKRTMVDAPELMGKRRTIPTYEFFQTAAERDIPFWKIELAASGRARCTGSRKSLGSVGRCRNVNEGSKVDQPRSVGPGPGPGPGSSRALVADVFGIIKKNAVRVGLMDPESGAYCRFVHLRCWRVPQAVWYNLPQYPDDTTEYSVDEFKRRLVDMDGVVFVGLNKLCDEDITLVAEHAMNQEAWAAFNQKKYVAARAAGLPSSRVQLLSKDEIKVLQKLMSKATSLVQEPEQDEPLAAVTKQESKPEPKRTDHDEYDVVTDDDEHEDGLQVAPNVGTAIAVQKPKEEKPPPKILIPVPGENGAIANSLLRDNSKPMTFVLTGIFPDLGGDRIGLMQGKDMAEKLIQRFGGVVRSAVSGATDVLLVGEEPGVSKLSAARTKANCKVLNLEHILDMIHGRSIEGTRLQIERFSTGFHGNSLAYDMTRAELEELRTGAKALPSTTKTEEPQLLPSSKSTTRKRKALPLSTKDEAQKNLTLPAPDKPPRNKKPKRSPKAPVRSSRRLAALTNAA